MNCVGKHLADGLNIKLNTTVKPIQRSANDWQLETVDGEQLGSFDWVLSTAPVAQTRELLPACSYSAVLTDTHMLGCCALMLGFPANAIPTIDWQAALVREADISWVSVNSSKPGRDAAFSIVVHSTNAYAEASQHEDPDSVEAHLYKELLAVTGIDAANADHSVLHRWRYANIPQQTGDAALIDTTLKLGACGDWRLHGRVEAAFLSGLDLANSLREQL
ncbi:MAG: NAD(P)/FAD-dependent oxidoreductase, partial [Gammaproteobacteria bacterium]